MKNTKIRDRKYSIFKPKTGNENFHERIQDNNVRLVVGTNNVIVYCTVFLFIVSMLCQKITFKWHIPVTLLNANECFSQSAQHYTQEE
jgi:hypothetical protein